MNPLRSRHRHIGHDAFTVIELMVAVSILTLIVLALFSMFDQTQKALRGNAAQVDVLEGGRTAMEMLSREIEQMVAAGGDTPYATNAYPHLVVEHASPPSYQRLAGTNAWRANVLSDLYFLTRADRIWTGIGYRVLSAQYVDQPGGKGATLVTNLAQGGCGFLARMSVSSNWALPSLVTNRVSMFNNLAQSTPAALSRYQRVVDGVVHFRLRMLDSRGQPIPATNIVDGMFPSHIGVFADPPVLWNEFGPPSVRFYAGVLPASVEVELGILEPQIVERLASLTSYSARTNYLAKQASRVHLFQQRIPIRNARTILPVTP